MFSCAVPVLPATGQLPQALPNASAAVPDTGTASSIAVMLPSVGLLQDLVARALVRDEDLPVALGRLHRERLTVAAVVRDRLVPGGHVDGEIATEPVASAGTASRPSVARSMPIISSAMFATTSAPTSRISCAKTTLTECSVADQRSMRADPAALGVRDAVVFVVPCGRAPGEELEYVWVGGTPTLNAPARTNGLNADPGWWPVVARSSSSCR